MKNRLFLIIVCILTLGTYARGKEANRDKPLFRIRTITAGVNLASLSDLSTIESALAFLARTNKEFETAGYEVQTLRIATQPLNETLNEPREKAISALKDIDSLISEKNVVLSIGPVITEDR
ncbi:DUF711 family protein, partial [candidate division KSB1 bacterium]|nr:DUF711 family protein [candidate division KSB1 bacterium]NIR68429.1 DUF711 family protein [candidate division KSB1 bacterium]NIS25381.1 DUF711 family protein [candidate division KSB1 bacterium]NIT72258.1 DUF711 family protein [candidate division KSB1 bacterium]NIU26063.1 DUF711 family protein [candidate division KSB1 bacterium]